MKKKSLIRLYVSLGLIALASNASGDGFDSVISLGNLDGTNGFRIDGINNSDRSGISVSGAGDVNDDGISDLIIGGYGPSSAGKSYMVFGQPGGLGSSLDLSGLNGTNGFRIDGMDGGDVAGYSVSGAGDFNGDHIDDVILGAPYANGYAGESYLIFGQSAGFGSVLNLSALDGTNGFRIDGVDANDQSGRSVSGAGDVNGDGVDDVILGAYGANGYAGESYVVFGQTNSVGSSFALSSLNGTNGFRIDGIDGGDYCGISVSGTGDINGDGFDDLIIGASKAAPGGNLSAGESYVVFGGAGGFSASMALSALNGANGFRMDGMDASDLSGYSVSGAGDVNGDGVDDLVVGARWANGKAGEGYVVFGHTHGFNASIALNALNGSNGFRMDGIDGNDNCG